MVFDFIPFLSPPSPSLLFLLMKMETVWREGWRTRRGFINNEKIPFYLSFRWHGNLIKQLDCHPLSLSRFIAQRSFRVIDETEAISTRGHKYIYFTRMDYILQPLTCYDGRLIDRRILTSTCLPFYRNFNKRLIFIGSLHGSYENNFNLPAPSLLLIWTVAPRLNQVWR